MAAAHAFLDILANAHVRDAYLAGRVALILSADLETVLWANGAAARFLGFGSVAESLQAAGCFDASARGQILAAIAGGKAAALRGADYTQNFLAGRFNVPPLGDVVFLRSVAAAVSGNGPVDLTEGLSDETSEAALLDLSGQIMYADSSFNPAICGDAGLQPLLAEAYRDGKVKKRFLGGANPYPVGVLRLNREPPIFLVIAARGAGDSADEQAQRSETGRGIEAADERAQRSETRRIAEELDEQAAPMSERSGARLGAQKTPPMSERSAARQGADETRETKRAREPARFVWSSDAEGFLTEISPQLARYAGSVYADIIGRDFADLAEKWQMDKDGTLAALLQSGRPWAGQILRWPCADAEARLIMELSALPVRSAGGEFMGFRGFGLINGVEKMDYEETRRPSGQDAKDEEGRNLSPQEQEAFFAIARHLQRDFHADAAAVQAAFAPPSDLAPPQAEEPAALGGEAAADNAPAGRFAAGESAPSGVEAVRDKQANAVFDELAAAIRRAAAEDAEADYKAERQAAADAPLPEEAEQESGAAAYAGGRPIELPFPPEAEKAELTGAENPAGAGIAETGINEQSGAESARALSGGAASLQAVNGAEAEAAAPESPAPPAAQLRAETALRESQARLRQRTDEAAALRYQKDRLNFLLNALSEAVLISDKAGIILSANGAAARMFGRPAAAMPGAALSSLFSAEAAAALRHDIDKAEASSAGAFLNPGKEAEGRAAQGGILKLRLNFGCLEQGKTYFLLMRDMTRFHEIISALLRKNAEEEQAYQRQARYLALISHEIRTPLNAIIGMAQLMAGEQGGLLPPEKCREYSGDIIRGAEHIMSLVNDILLSAKDKADRLKPNIKPVSLWDIAQEVLALMIPQANAANIIMRSAVAGDLPKIAADARAVKQILLNLIGNAVHYTPQGGQILISAHELRERAADNAADSESARLSGAADKDARADAAAGGREYSRYVLMRISDSGVGMSEEQIARSLRNPLDEEDYPHETAGGGRGDSGADAAEQSAAERGDRADERKGAALSETRRGERADERGEIRRKEEAFGERGTYRAQAQADAQSETEHEGEYAAGGINPPKYAVKGAGLGLPMAYALAEANNIRLSLSSEPGKGTIAALLFPIAEAETQGKTEAAE